MCLKRRAKEGKSKGSENKDQKAEIKKQKELEIKERLFKITIAQYFAIDILFILAHMKLKN